MPAFTKAVNETNSTEGAELLINEVKDTFMKYLQETPIMSKIFRTSKVKTKTREYVKTTDLGSVTWLTDDVTGYPVTATQPSYTRETVSVYKIMKRVPVTRDLIEDEEFDAIARLVQDSAEQVAVAIDKAILEGDGSTTGFTGILNWSGVVVLDKGTAGTSGASMDPDYILEAVMEISKNYGNATAVVLRPEHEFLLATLKDSNGSYVLNKAQYGSPILAEGAVGTIWGLKVYRTSVITVDTTTYVDATAPIYVIDGKAGEILMRTDLQVFTDNDYANDLVEYFFRIRVGFYLGRPGHVAVIKGVKIA